MKSIKKIKKAALSCFLMILLAAGGLTGTADADDTVILWAWDEAFNIKAARLAAREYEKSHPGIKIRVVNMEQEDIMDKLDNCLASGIYEELPDIVLMEDYRNKAYLKKYPDEFLDLTDEINFEDFIDYKVRAVTEEGRQYGIPFDCGAAVLFYRLDYLERAGYGEEDMQDLTWERFIEIGKEVREKTGIPMMTVEPDDLGMIRLLIQSAGSWYVKPGGEQADIEGNKALEEAVKIYESCIRENLTIPVNGWNEFIHAFQDGKVATVPYGCWLASSMKAKEDQSGQWRVARFPRMGSVPESVNASNIGGSSWYILKKKEHSRKALSFMKEMFAESPEFIDTLIEEINLVTAYKQAEELANYQKEDEFFGGTNVMELYRQTALLTPEVDFGWNTYAIEDIFSQEVLKILLGEDRKNAFRRAQEKAQAAIGT